MAAQASARWLGFVADAGIAAGPCGAATLAGLRALLTGPYPERTRRALDLHENSTVVLLSTGGSAANPALTY